MLYSLISFSQHILAKKNTGVEPMPTLPETDVEKR